ncbi:hypothetical protein HK096_006654 [Nowakowskiella sp. JEL0078]|nr:hypothetical protein HK096_006654 [Nowakowskiella sp. JEL0078]
MSLEHFKNTKAYDGTVEYITFYFPLTPFIFSFESRKKLEFAVLSENPNDQLLILFQTGDVLRIKEIKALVSISFNN